MDLQKRDYDDKKLLNALTLFDFYNILNLLKDLEKGPSLLS